MTNLFWSGNLARDHLHDLEADGRILNDSKQRRYEGMAWLKIWFIGGLVHAVMDFGVP